MAQGRFARFVLTSEQFINIDSSEVNDRNVSAPFLKGIIMTVLDNEPTASALKALIEGAELSDGLLVNINYVEGHDPKRSRRLGLDKAREYARDTGNPVVMTSVEAEEELRKDPVFVRLMERPNVRFVRMPTSLEVLLKTCQSIQQQ